MNPLSVDDVHDWVDAAQKRWAADLQFRELRRGVQAVSDLYVHKRKGRSLSSGAVDGRGKRAGFVVYFGGLHLLLVQSWLEQVPRPALERVWDLGCGPGVVGAAAARWGGCSSVHASDRLGSHLEVAAWSARQLRVQARTRKASLPHVLDTVRGPGLITLGWVLNELDDAARGATIDGLERRIRAGTGVLILAPLSLRASPWWGAVVRRLRDSRPDLVSEEYRFQPELPQLIRDLDRATRLNHRTLGARVLYVPPGVSGQPAKG